MNKAILTVMLMVFVVFGSHQAWAMGKRHHSSGDSFSYHTGGPNGFSGTNTNNPPGGPSGPAWNDDKDCGFPSGVTVPEPASLLLMGAGALAGGVLLKRKKA
jgi:hypothetical protein